MKRNDSEILKVEQFYTMFHNGFDFVYLLANQSKERQEELWYISDERKVYTDIKIASTLTTIPDCILFGNNNGDRLTIEFVDRIRIHEHNSPSKQECYIDIVCRVGNKEQVITMLARQKGARL